MTDSNNTSKTRETSAPDKTTQNIEHFDVVISGGGLSGVLTALSLAKLSSPKGNPLSMAIIEKHSVQTDTSLSFDDRVLALSHGTCEIFKALGNWQTLQNDAQAIKDIHISDRGYYGKARLYAKDHHVSAFGYVVEMSLIGKSLLVALAKHHNVTWLSPDKINLITWQKEQVDLVLDSGQKLSTRLLLGCDGEQSICRQLANIPVSEHNYHQCALIANVSTQKPHNNIAYERFTETGPIAMLPLSNSEGKNRCSLVWTLTPELAEHVKALDNNALREKLEQDFGLWLGQINDIGKCDIYPLKLLQASEQIYHRMVLIGNASHTIHPVSGQGFNLGVRDIEQLTSKIKQALSQGEDIGNFSLLNTYANERKQDHTQIIALTDSLVTLFSNKLPPLIVGRNIGLKILNYLPPLKNALVKKTMGY